MRYGDGTYYSGYSNIVNNIFDLAGHAEEWSAEEGTGVGGNWTGILRGGNAVNTNGDARRSALRSGTNTESRSYFVGFRVVLYKPVAET